jgi:hypothetical protein
VSKKTALPAEDALTPDREAGGCSARRCDSSRREGYPLATPCSAA